jgi:hypothetical protein
MLNKTRMLLSISIALASASAALATTNDTSLLPSFEPRPQRYQQQFAHDLKSPAETPSGPYFYVDTYGVPLTAGHQVHSLGRATHGAKTRDR